MRKLMKLAAMLFAATMFFASCEEGIDDPNADYAEGIVGEYTGLWGFMGSNGDIEIEITRTGENEVNIVTSNIVVSPVITIPSINVKATTSQGTDIKGTTTISFTPPSASEPLPFNVEFTGTISPELKTGIINIDVDGVGKIPITITKKTDEIAGSAAGIVGKYSGIGQAEKLYEGELEIEITEKSENEVNIVTGDIEIPGITTIPAIETTLTTSAGDAGAIAVDGELTVSVELIPGTPMPVPVTITGSIEPKTGIGLLTITATVEGTPIPVPIAVTRKTAE